MRILALLVLGLYLAFVPAASAAEQDDLQHAPSCRECGMDRAKFNFSRMFIEYQDGSRVGTCSLHCVAVELANAIDRIPAHVLVADYDSKKLIDAEDAVWVIGGARKGVMTAQPKWAFSARAAAEKFLKENGGSIATFDEAIKAAYLDMYQDTKMIRGLRELKRGKQGDITQHRQ